LHVNEKNGIYDSHYFHTVFSNYRFIHLNVEPYFLPYVFKLSFYITYRYKAEKRRDKCQINKQNKITTTTTERFDLGSVQTSKSQQIMPKHLTQSSNIYFSFLILSLAVIAAEEKNIT